MSTRHSVLSFLLPAAVVATALTVPAPTTAQACDLYCQEIETGFIPGRECVTVGGPGSSGPHACITQDGIEELCEIAYGQSHCHECDINYCFASGGGPCTRMAPVPTLAAVVSPPSAIPVVRRPDKNRVAESRAGDLTTPRSDRTQDWLRTYSATR
jgi:hypothetical protein